MSRQTEREEKLIMGAVIRRLLQVLWRTVLAEAIRRSLAALCRRHRRR